MAGHLRNIVGNVYGRLTVIGFAGYHDHPSGGRSAKWLCRCECGTEKEVIGQGLKRGLVQACGCMRLERAKAANTTHGAANRNSAKKDRRLYCVWMTIKQRCYDQSSCEYPNYGGRGIVMCSRWRESFAAFRDDMGYPPPKHSIERIDNGGNYEPSNCKWATMAEQSRNKRNNHQITHNGETLVIRDWSLRLGGNRSLVARRLMLGWSIERAVTTPAMNRFGVGGVK
jgi:hypothetical protein